MLIPKTEEKNIEKNKIKEEKHIQKQPHPTIPIDVKNKKTKKLLTQTQQKYIWKKKNTNNIL